MLSLGLLLLPLLLLVGCRGDEGASTAMDGMIYGVPGRRVRGDDRGADRARCHRPVADQMLLDLDVPECVAQAGGGSA